MIGLGTNCNCNNLLPYILIMAGKGAWYNRLQRLNGCHVDYSCTMYWRLKHVPVTRFWWNANSIYVVRTYNPLRACMSTFTVKSQSMWTKLQKTHTDTNRSHNPKQGNYMHQKWNVAPYEMKCEHFVFWYTISIYLGIFNPMSLNM